MEDHTNEIQPLQENSPAQAQPPVKTSRAAIASLICGILGFAFLPAVAGLILGIFALINTGKHKGALKGKGIAITGTVLSGIFILVSPVIMIIFLAMAAQNTVGFSIPDNEDSAISALRILAKAEQKWYNEDLDRNGKNDYWTYDISCLYRLCLQDNTTKVAAIDLSIARADANPAEIKGGVEPFSQTLQIEPWHSWKTALRPKDGYYFQAMELDEDDKIYNQDWVGDRVRATNAMKFAFVAFPVEYPKTGVRTFIVDQSGTVYGTDTSGATRVVKWPGKDPTQITAKGGQNWIVIKE